MGHGTKAILLGLGAVLCFGVAGVVASQGERTGERTIVAPVPEGWQQGLRRIDKVRCYIDRREVPCDDRFYHGR